jgi:hypothetical protein
MHMHTIDAAAVTALLGQAGAAHGVYEERELGGVYDQQWPQWYAAYLVTHGLGELVGAPVTAEQVATWLSACDAAYKAERPARGWAAYYAGRARLLQTEGERAV